MELDPLNFIVHTEFTEQRAGGTRFFRSADAVELVQRRLKLKTPANETRGKSARQIMLLTYETAFAGREKLCSRPKSAVSGADHDRIIVFHTLPFPYALTV